MRHSILRPALALLLSLGLTLGSALAFSPQPDAWAAVQVAELERAGLLQHVDTAAKNPRSPVTRGEFCQIMVDLLKKEGDAGRLSQVAPKEADYFADLASTVTAADPGGRYQLYYAAAYGLLEGSVENGQRLAGADGLLNREQAAKMMCALLDALEQYGVPAAGQAGTAKTFADQGSISGWALPYVQRASALEILKGDNQDRFNPQSTLTWQEVCVMLDRTYQAAEEARVSQAEGVSRLYSQEKQRAHTDADRPGGLWLLQDGSLVSVSLSRDEVKVERFNADGSSAGVRDIPMELSVCGGFYEGKDAYYLAFGQYNPDEIDRMEVYRIVKYDKNWNRLGAASITGGESFTTSPCSGGSHAIHAAMAEENGTLVFHTARTRYVDNNDGVHHQSNFTAKIRTSDMTVLWAADRFPKNSVSHSFQQYVLFDDGDILYGDHGDASPRAFAWTREDASGTCERGSALEIAGELGDNETNASGGGIGASNTHYFFAGASTYQRSGSDSGYANAFLSVAPKDVFPRGSGEVQWLTNYDLGEDTYVAGARLVQIDRNTFVVMWQTGSKREGYFTARGEFSYAVFDGQGNQVGQTVTKPGFALPCSTPTVTGNTIRWVRPDTTRGEAYTNVLRCYELEISPNTAQTVVTPKPDDSFTSSADDAVYYVEIEPSIFYLKVGQRAVATPVYHGLPAGAQPLLTYSPIGDGKDCISITPDGAITALKPGTVVVDVEFGYKNGFYGTSFLVYVEP